MIRVPHMHRDFKPTATSRQSYCTGGSEEPHFFSYPLIHHLAYLHHNGDYIIAQQHLRPTRCTTHRRSARSPDAHPIIYTLHSVLAIKPQHLGTLPLFQLGAVLPIQRSCASRVISNDWLPFFVSRAELDRVSGA
jgi:hypothetical protein